MGKSGPKLPRSGPAREALREKGQFWTPDWVAEAMVVYVVSGGAKSVFDPAVGTGVFFRAVRTISRLTGTALNCCGTETDPAALQGALASGLSDADLAQVEIRDFLLSPPRCTFEAIVANPPYIRHHRVPTHVKRRLRAFGAELLGKPLDGRAGIHVYFLLRALTLLAPAGRLAFIMPADTAEGVFADSLWSWIAARYRIHAVVTFTAEASPFPGVDTNALVFMIENAPPLKQLVWAVCKEAQTQELVRWALNGCGAGDGQALTTCRRALGEALTTGLSRPPNTCSPADPKLVEFAQVMRGIATGANDFFFLTAARAEELGLPAEFLKPAVGRTRDVSGDHVDAATLRGLQDVGRPTLLLSVDGRPTHALPEPVREYLKKAERQGLPDRPLIRSRKPWYKMEVRRAPPFLFAYLGRRNTRFIRNLAGVIPLTGFLCVYPRRDDPFFIAKLWAVLSHPETVARLSLVGKSYGGGALKVEPRALERLPLPAKVVAEAGLGKPPRSAQMQLQL